MNNFKMDINRPLRRTIIAGSRDCLDMSALLEAISKAPWNISVVISGTAAGVDSMGEEWASYHDIIIERFPAEWKKYGKSAGYKRNNEMAKNADALIAVWDGISKGTLNMIKIAQAKKLNVYVHIVLPNY